MADSLSHSCPTCEGTGTDASECESPMCGINPCGCYPCPDCIGGYPRAAVERAAEAVDCFEVFTASDGLQGIRPRDPMAEALAAIRAFHNEGSEG